MAGDSEKKSPVSDTQAKGSIKDGIGFNEEGYEIASYTPVSVSNKREINRLIPYNMQGNKTQLLSESIGGLVELAAKTSKRIIDAFGGSGTYTHFIKNAGLGSNDDIFNEYSPLRYIANKQLKDSPKDTIKAFNSLVNDVQNKLKNIDNGSVFNDVRKQDRIDITNYLNDRISRFVLPNQDYKKLKKEKLPVEFQDHHELAALYLFVQNQRFGFRAIQGESSGYGVKPLLSASELESLSSRRGLVKKFARGTDKLFDKGVMTEAAKRLENVNISRGDGWNLVKNEAKSGDLIFVDTSYLNRGGKKTSNYDKGIEHDAIPEVYINKIEDNVLPAWDKGAKLIITNNYDVNVAKYLKDHGFTILTANRGKGVSNDTQELIAINFDTTTGEINKRREDVDSESTGNIRRKDRRDGGKDSGQDSRERLAGGAKKYSKGLHRTGRIENTTGSTKEKIESLLPRRVRKLVQQGKLNVVQSVSDISGKAYSFKNDEGIEGFYDADTDTLYLVADQLTSGNLNSTLNHELFHSARATDTKLQSQLEYMTGHGETVLNTLTIELKYDFY